MELERFKAAAARLFFDMINADGVIEDNEILILEGLGKYVPKDKEGHTIDLPDFTKEANEIIRSGGLRKKYKIEQEDIQESTRLTTCEAIQILKRWQEEVEPEELKYDSNYIFRAENVKEDLKAISGCDGSRDLCEAKLLAAVSLCLNNRISPENRAIPISYRERNLRFAKKEIVYLESEFDEKINKDIVDNRLHLENLLSVYGYDFVYIPEVVRFLRNKAQMGLLTPILMFSKPFYYKDADKADQFADEIQNITTAEFTETFASAAHLEENLPPSLLIKVKTSTIESTDEQGKPKKVKFTDFIAIPVTGSVIEAARRLPDNILEFTDSITALIIKAPNEKLYCKGIHKTLIDYVVHRSSTNLVTQVVFTLKGKNRNVQFVGVDGGKVSMKPAELVLYLMHIIYASYGTGIPKRKSDSAECIKIKEVFKRIYEQTEKDKDIPDMFRSMSPQKTSIRNKIRSLSTFEDREKYNLVDDGDRTKALINSEIIFIREPRDNSLTQLDEWLLKYKIL